MKRIIALCLCFVSIFSFSITVNAGQQTQDMTKEERFMIGSGIFSMEYKPESELTRAEFAAILSNALRLVQTGETADSWLGSETTQLDVTIADNAFEDVDASHPYYKEIQAVKNRGVMVGVSQNLFAPEYSITLNEAQKVILSLMGYDIMAIKDGGYPEGYTKYASITGLTDGIGKSPESVITHKDAIKLIYNALDIELMEITNIGAEVEYSYSEETFLTGVLKIGKEKGIMTDNGYTAIDGNTKAGIGNITVNSVTAQLTNNTVTSTGYLGREVLMYYVVDEYDENLVVYVDEVESADTVTFDIDDFVSLQGDKITYQLGNRIYTKTLNKNAEMIINNELVDVFSEETFNFADGDVTLINDNDGYNTIIANKYEYAVVSSVDSEKMLVFNKLKGGESEAKYDFSGEVIDEKAIRILNQNGEKLSFSELGVGDTLNIKRSANFMEVIKANNVVDGVKFTKHLQEDDYSIYSNNEIQYKTSENFEKLTNKPNIVMAEEYSLYLSIFGDIIWVDNAEDAYSDMRMGILLDVDFFEDEVDEAMQKSIKIYGDESKFERYYVGERIRVNGKNIKFENDGVPNSVLTDAIGEMVLYSTDEEGALSEIVIAGEFGSDTVNGWYKIVPDGTYTYESNGHAFDTLFFSPDVPTVFEAPASEKYFGDPNNFSYNSSSFDNNVKYTVQAYSKHKDNILADVILVRLPDSTYETGSGVSASYSIIHGDAFLISDISTTLDEDDNIITKMSGYRFRTGVSPVKAEFTLDENAVMVGFGGQASSVLDKDGNLKDKNYDGPKTPDELEPGDIIYYNITGKGKIKAARIAYDYSAGKPYNGADGTDFYNTTSYAAARNTTWAGTLVSKYGKGIRFATNHNPEAIDFTNSADVIANVRTSEIRNPANITIVEKVGKKVKVTPGSLNDLITFNETGTSENADDVVVLAYMRSLNYGTIIYKK